MACAATPLSRWCTLSGAGAMSWPRPGPSSTTARSLPLTLYITGELDLDTVAELKRTLLAHVSSAAGHVTVDLSEVTFMGADGFGLLRPASARQYERAGVALMLGPTSRCAQRVLAILAWSDARVRPLGRRDDDAGARAAGELSAASLSAGRCWRR